MGTPSGDLGRVLTIARLGNGARAIEYYLDRQVGCGHDQVGYYTDAGEPRGVWCGGGARALGLTGALDAAGEAVIRGLLAGETVEGERLVRPELRGDPRGRVLAAPLVAAVAERAAQDGVDPASMLGDDRLAEVFQGLVAAVAVDARQPRRPRASVPADVAGRLSAAVGECPHDVYRRGDTDVYAEAMRFVDARVDVRRAGLDLTFSAPKSVSVLFGLGDDRVAGEVREAHAAAVTQTVDYLEGLCARASRGRGRSGGTVGTDGWYATAFEHRSSRADDPQLHTHVVVPNVVRGNDGHWSAFDTRETYRQALTGGYLYQAVLRGELTRRLGVGWGPVRRGVAEIHGVPPALRRLFSARREAIEEHLAEHGQSGPKAAQVAALRTREAKRPHTDEELRQAWGQRARDAGCDPGVLLGEVVGRVPEGPDLDVESVIAAVLGSEGVTARSSTFDRRGLLRAACEAIPAGADVTLSRLREVATTLVRDARVVPVAIHVPVEQRRYSTAQLLATEASALRTAGERLGDGLGRVEPAAVDTALAASGLSAEQAELVRQVTTSGAGVEVIVGPAGSGKTAALAVAHQLWGQAGLPVAGTALAAIAARTLREGAGIPSVSMARLLRSLDGEPRHRRLPPAGGVLVVDEAGMVGTRDLASLIELTRRERVKLVLVGDPAQLPEIDAGGLFAALAERMPTAALAGNVRQREPWERNALTSMRDGDVLDAVVSYDAAGRVHLGESTGDLRAQIVTDYLAHRVADPRADVVMLTSRRDDARTLNRLTRQRLVEAGALGGDGLSVSVRGRTREFRVGDEVVVTANRYPLGLLNGTRGTVTGVDAHAGVTVTAGETRTTVPPEDLAAGVLDHGYALTCHRAQGITVDVGLLYASRSLTREGGYVGMSRGRVENHLYATWEALVPEVDVELDHPGVEPVAEWERAELTASALVERLETSAAQRLAVEQMPAAGQEWVESWLVEDEWGRAVGRNR